MYPHMWLTHIGEFINKPEKCRVCSLVIAIAAFGNGFRPIFVVLLLLNRVSVGRNSVAMI